MRLRTLLLAMLVCVAPGCWRSEPFVRLGHGVVAAEYSQSLGLVAMVSAGPPSLHLYDPILRSEVTVPLSADPTCVGISPDGLHAAVGHDGLITYVDLDTASVAAVYTVPAAVADIVLADDGYVHAFVSNGPTIEVELSSGAVSRGPVYSTSARQRPGTASIYAVEFGRLRKVDIRAGILSLGYRDPWSYRSCNRIWTSEDGRRIYSACGDTYRASSSIDQDMQYTGSFPNRTSLQGLATSSAAHHVLTIPITGDPQSDTRLDLHHDAYLEYRGSMQLPSFVVGGDRFASHGRYVFFDASGRFFVTILQADATAGLANDLAVFTAAFHPASFTGASGPTPPALPPQSFTIFDHTIEDAEYADDLDRIVYAACDPSALHILDPESGTEQVVMLPFPPNSVSIDPDGERAAIGHDGGSVSVVDLRTASLVANHPTTREVLDAVLVADRVYAFPRQNGSEALREIDVATGLLDRDWTNGVSGDARAKLDASRTKLYVANNHLNPSGLTVFDITQRPARYVRFVSPRPEICGDIWLSEDGRRIFTRCGAVLRSSLVPATDLSVEGQLAGVTSIRHLSDSTEAGTIAVVPGIRNFDGYGFSDSIGTDRVDLFDSTSLALAGSFDLPDFVLGATTRGSRGAFAFINRAGTRLHVIFQIEPGGGLAAGYGLVSFDL